MITKTSRESAQKYEWLFSMAKEELLNRHLLSSQEDIDNLTLNGIKSLEEYFYYLKTLVGASSTVEPWLKARFISLPLDEEPFEIDANTRQIKIPACFKDGISVMGDQAAEVIYFKIDRYFDHMDLSTVHIMIEYQDSKSEWHYANVDIIDNTSEAGKIIFGWPVSLDATKYSGNIKIAVRFYLLDKETKELLYSLRTMPITVRIKDSIGYDFDLNNFIDGEGTQDSFSLDTILNRIQQSDVYAADTTDDPIFIEPKDESNPIIAFIGESDGIKFIDGVYEQGDDNITDSYLILAQAYAPTLDSTFSYTWKRELPPNIFYINDDGNIVNTEVGKEISYNVMSSSDNGVDTFFPVYVKTTDTKWDNRKSYWRKSESSNGTLESASQVDNPSESELYELKNALKIDKFGNYTVIIKGKGRFDKAKERIVCKVPTPKASNIVLSNNFSNGEIINKLFDNEGTEEDAITLNAEAYISSDSEYYEKENNLGEFTYQWFKADFDKVNLNNIDIKKFSPIEGATSPEITINRTEEELIGKYYLVQVTETLNKAMVRKESDIAVVDYGPYPIIAEKFSINTPDGNSTEFKDQIIIDDGFGLVQTKPIVGTPEDGEDIPVGSIINFSRSRLTNRGEKSIITWERRQSDNWIVDNTCPTYNLDSEQTELTEKSVGKTYRCIITTSYKGNAVDNCVAYITVTDNN